MGLNLVLLRALFEEKLVDLGESKGDVWIKIQAVDLMTIVEQLRIHPELKFDWFVDLCGVDFHGKTPRFETVVHLHSMDLGHRIRIHCLVPDGSLTVPSLTPLWPAANWFEREAFDMYGVRFQGHPNLDRILNPPGTTEFPQRKDYPLLGSRAKKEDL